VVVIANGHLIGSLQDAVDTLAVRTVVQLELTNTVLVRLLFNGILADLRDTLRR